MKKKISIKLKSSSDQNQSKTTVSKTKIQSKPISKPPLLISAKRIKNDFLVPVLNLIDNDGLDNEGNCLLTIDGLYIIKEVLENIIDLNSKSNINEILYSLLEEEEEEQEQEQEQEIDEYEEYEEDEDDDEEEDESYENESEDPLSEVYNAHEIEELNELDDYNVDVDGDFYEN